MQCARSQFVTMVNNSAQHFKKYKIFCKFNLIIIIIQDYEDDIAQSFDENYGVSPGTSKKMNLFIR